MRRLVGALLERGWTVHFVGPVPPGPAHAGLVFHAVPAVDGRPSLRTLARCFRVAAGLSLANRVRYLWTFGSAYGALLSPLRLLPGRRMATFLRGSLSEQERAQGHGKPRRALVALAERTALAASDTVVAVSHDLARRAGPRSIVLPNDAPAAAPAADAADARRELGLPAGAFIVGTAGSITPVKSLETLVRAAALLPEAHVAVQGLAREETPYEGALRRLAADLGASARVHLLPWAPGARLLLSALDVVVVASRHEGCPNVLLEAMAMGRPCLGARSGGIEELLVDDDLLFPPGDAEGLAERLARLRDDPDERHRLAARARSRAAAYVFDWESRAVAILEAAFREA